jgi:hypothetical protein
MKFSCSAAEYGIKMKYKTKQRVKNYRSGFLPLEKRAASRAL